MIKLAESGRVPDLLVRLGIRQLLRGRLRAERRDKRVGRPEIAWSLEPGQLAVATERANEQHYELPPEFFRLMLGPRLKYSSCHWSPGVRTLGEAEDEMLRLTCARAGVEDRMRVLDLGCGWGSLSLSIAANYPGCEVTAVSNSKSQARFIEEQAAELRLGNVRVVRADVNRFAPAEAFDRVVSVEMFEHVRNHAALLSRIAGWLAPEGKLFVHLFCHREHSYAFEVDGDNDWMARHFFTGGVMPSLELLERVNDALRVEQSWTVDGTHYQRTLLAWLDRLDRHREEALVTLGRHYGAGHARLWLVRWRIFLLASAELFGYRRGGEWMVAHYLMRKPAGGP